VALLKLEPLGVDEVTEQHRDPFALSLRQERARPQRCGTLALPRGLRFEAWHGLCPTASRTWEEFLYFRNETIAPTTYGPYVALAAPIVAHGLARFHDAMVHGGLTHKALRPYVLHKFLLAHDTVAMRDKVAENIEHLRFKLAQCPSTPEFVELGVEGVVIKEIEHGHLPEAG
jgi:hypothetical protein